MPPTDNIIKRACMQDLSHTKSFVYLEDSEFIFALQNLRARLSSYK